jgi:hypothetical protein
LSPKSSILPSSFLGVGRKTFMNQSLKWSIQTSQWYARVHIQTPWSFQHTRPHMCCGPCGRHRVATADQLQSCKNSLRSVILNGSSFPFLKMALKQPGFCHSWMCEMWNVLYSLGNPGEKVLYCLLTDSCLSSFTMFAPLIVRTG